MLELLQHLPPLGVQRHALDPFVYARGELNGARWFILEYDVDTHVAFGLVDDDAPLRLETFCVAELMTRREAVIPSDFAERFGNAAMRFHLSEIKQTTLSSVVAGCRLRVRAFPRPADDIPRPDPVKMKQSITELVTSNRWVNR